MVACEACCGERNITEHNRQALGNDGREDFVGRWLIHGGNGGGDGGTDDVRVTVGRWRMLVTFFGRVRELEQVQVAANGATRAQKR
jgi:hypothetical protein